MRTISTGSSALDSILGTEGLGISGITELFGDAATGKTTLTYHLIANAQRAGGNAAFVDVEHSFCEEYALAIGVDLSSLVLVSPQSGEEALTIAERLIASMAFDVVVIDSAAALNPVTPAAANEHVDMRSRLLSNALRRISAACIATRTLCVFTNHIRNMQQNHGSGKLSGEEIAPGGIALKLHATYRIKFQYLADELNAAGQKIGNRVRLIPIKSKIPLFGVYADVVMLNSVGMVDIATNPKKDIHAA